MLNLLFFYVIQAQQGLGTIQKPQSNLIKSDARSSISALVTSFLGLATVIAGLVFFVMLILGGLRWVSSGGDKAAVDSARGMITNGLIGLVIVVAALAITRIVETVLQIDILNFNLPGSNPG